jgi:hypothetical protein
MKALLVVSAAIELSAGLALLLAPSLAASLLLGSPLGTPSAIVLGHLAGLALIALGVGCWLARNRDEGGTASPIFAAMLFYNAAAALLLVYARLGMALVGAFLWPAVLLHAAMTVWYVASLLRKSA